MFNAEEFIGECIAMAPEGPGALRECIQRALEDPGGILAALGEPDKPGMYCLYEGSELTVVNYVWPPRMNLLPHNHQMFALIGVYSGREENVLWQRNGNSIQPAGAVSLGVHDTTTLGKDSIHSVFNPLMKCTAALHIYGGDINNPNEPRSQWDPETLAEAPWDYQQVDPLIEETARRFWM